MSLHHSIPFACISAQSPRCQSSGRTSGWIEYSPGWVTSFMGPHLYIPASLKPTVFNKRKTWINEIQNMHVTPQYKKSISTHISKISPTKLQSKVLWSHTSVKAAEDEKLWAQFPSVSGVVTLLCKDPPNGLREHFPSAPPAALSWPPGYVWSVKYFC